MASQSLAPVMEYLTRHGYATLFAVVLAEQVGAPVPAVPVLLAIGALLGEHGFTATGALLIAVAACLLADTMWFLIGRRRGASVLQLLCRISLEPDSCVSSSRYWFRRLGAWLLLIAKFVPGLSTVAPPMAAISKMEIWRFLLADGLGSALWAGAFLSLGYLFRTELEYIGDLAGRTGFSLVALVALWALFKWWQRWRFIRSLRIARLSPEELLERIRAKEPLTIIDLRHAVEVEAHSQKIAGAIWIDRGRLDELHIDIPRDRDVILYCT
ncbi:MAG: VTT domain-containing protein [Bryobacteraceae bacterium]